MSDSKLVMNGERILIVDDDPMSVKLVRALLTGEGYIVRSAKSAEEALTVLNTFDPRLILIDIQLPEVDGLELARRLRSNPSMYKFSIVALTAYAMQGDEQKAQSAGCDGYITKPIDIRTLASMVSRFLKEHGRRDGFPSGGALTNPGQGQLAEANRPAPAIESAELLPGDGLRPPASGDSGDLLSELRNNLLAQGMYEIPKLLASLETEFNADKARRFFHRWAGIAGTLGCPEITVQSRKLEELLT